MVTDSWEQDLRLAHAALAAIREYPRKRSTWPCWR